MRVRAPSPSLDRTLLARLSPLLNSSDARNELRWMKQALARTHPPPPANSCLESMIARRVSGEPLQYILGTQPFGPLELLTRPPVLIPRPETEDWALRLARALRPAADSSPARVLDLCTGSGCVGLLLAKLWPRSTARVLSLDISPDALQLATDNAREAGIPSSVDASQAPLFQVDHPEENTFDAVYGDLRDPDALRRALLPHRRFALLTANPPYIPPSAMSSLDPSVRAFEDTRALVGTDNDGLGFYRSIAALVQPAANRDEILAETAVVALEVGHGQARAVQEIVHRSRALDGTDIWLDPWGVERVVVGWRGRDDDVREELKRKLGAEAGPWK